VKRILALGALAAALVAPSAVARPAGSCTATAPDAFGPFGRGIPPMRAKIGKGGHVMTGVVLSAVTCAPLRGAQVQYWQAGKNGVYTRAGSGTVLTDRNGRFRFETPVPPRYEGRPPHIHLRVVAKDHVTLLARYEFSPGEKRASIRLVLRPIDL
jgi:protocatechuate 3,4-dioxygenase beta subunit